MTARTSKSQESAFETETDLRAITRDTDKCRTTVALYLDGYTRTPWLRFGQAQLSSQSERHTGRSRLEARMTAGVTDFEHDSAYALRLPLIGVQFDGLLVRYHTTFLIGWIDPDAEEDFHVPGPGYDPTKYEIFVMKEAVKIADTLKTPEAVEAFARTSWEEQKRLVSLSVDHSGNTFGAACRLAHVFLKEPALVPQMHGALCPLVGCESYGCWASTDEAKTRREGPKL
jgi:hypothetical protein